MRVLPMAGLLSLFGIGESEGYSRTYFFFDWSSSEYDGIDCKAGCGVFTSACFFPLRFLPFFLFFFFSRGVSSRDGRSKRIRLPEMMMGWWKEARTLNRRFWEPPRETGLFLGSTVDLFRPRLEGGVFFFFFLEFLGNGS